MTDALRTKKAHQPQKHGTKHVCVQELHVIEISETSIKRGLIPASPMHSSTTDFGYWRKAATEPLSVTPILIRP
jgi:hypothetical protein